MASQQIRSIHSGSNGASIPSNKSGLGTQQSASLAQGVAQIQAGMMNNVTLLNTIMELQNSPDMQAVLQDPELMSAIERFDLEVIRHHPKIHRLMRNAQVQGIQEEAN